MTADGWRNAESGNKKIGYYRLPWVTRSYRGLPGVTVGYQELPWVTRSYRGLPGVTVGYQELPWVTEDGGVSYR